MPAGGRFPPGVLPCTDRAPVRWQAAGCSPVGSRWCLYHCAGGRAGLHSRLIGGARAGGPAGRGAGADGGAASGGGVDAELAADGGDPVGHVGQPGSAGAGAGDAGAVVGDLADQLAGVVAQGDGDAGVVPGVFGGVVQRLQAAEVDRCFDRGRVAGGDAGVDGDRPRAAGGRGGERGGQPEVGQRRGVDAVGQAAQVGGRLVQVGAELAEQFGGAGGAGVPVLAGQPRGDGGGESGTVALRRAGRAGCGVVRRPRRRQPGPGTPAAARPGRRPAGGRGAAPGWRLWPAAGRRSARRCYATAAAPPCRP